MSLQNKRKQSSISKRSKRGKSVEHKQKISFRKNQNNEQTIENIIKQTVKVANQVITNQQAHLFQLIKAQQTQKKEMPQIPQQPPQKQPSTKPQFYTWQALKIEQKRKIKGIKSKLKWSNGKQNNFILLRAVITDKNQPDYFIQLDSSNIDLTLQQQKLIQKHINKMIDQEQEKLDENKIEIFLWLKDSLVNFHNFFMGLRFNQRKKGKEVQFKRYAINQNYMLYPCPASITWSPHGLLCVSGSKIGSIQKPIIGSVHSYKNLIEAPYKYERFARKINQNDDMKMVDQRNEQEQPTQADFFEWDAKQQINFSVFGKTGQQQYIQQSYQGNTTTQIQNQKTQKRITKDHQTFYLGNTNNISTKAQKIYRRYFANHTHTHTHIHINTSNTQQTSFQFIQKLKIYAIKSQNVELEDGILYLIDKIQRQNRIGVCEILLQNQFTGYHGAFNKIQKQPAKIEKLKYQLITEFLHEKIRITPHSQQFFFMKSVLIENQYFRLALQNYFQENFKRLKIMDYKYHCLGTFDNFDDITAQKLLFHLIETHLKIQKSSKQSAQTIKKKYRKNPNKYDDPAYKNQKYQKMQQQNEQMRLLLKGYVKKVPKHLPQLLQIESGVRKLDSQSEEKSDKQSLSHQKNHNKIHCRNVNLNIMPFVITNKFQFIPFTFNLILNPNQRKIFLQTVIPILWIKDRSNQKFQYKIAKRVIIANSKIINFIEKMNNIGNVCRKTGRANFLRSMLKEYEGFNRKKEATIGKFYVGYCQSCTMEFNAYSIQELLRVNRCSRCKYL